MIKRDITETVYEYDKEGKLVKKTVIEKHEEESPNTVLNHNDWWKYNQITCDNIQPLKYAETHTSTLSDSTNTVTAIKG